MPSERSSRSASVVPTVVVATITAQNRNGWKRRARIWAPTATTKSAAKIAVPTRVAEVHRHRHRVAAGLAERRRHDLDDPEPERDLRNLAEALCHANIFLVPFNAGRSTTRLAAIPGPMFSANDPSFREPRRLPSASVCSRPSKRHFRPRHRRREPNGSCQRHVRFRGGRRRLLRRDPGRPAERRSGRPPSCCSKPARPIARPGSTCRSATARRCGTRG